MSLLLIAWLIALVLTAALYVGVVTVQSVRRVLRPRPAHSSAPVRA